VADSYFCGCISSVLQTNLTFTLSFCASWAWALTIFTITVHFRDYLVLICLSIKWYLFPHLNSLSCLRCALCPQY
jgi:hypothetical protein